MNTRFGSNGLNKSAALLSLLLLGVAPSGISQQNEPIDSGAVAPPSDTTRFPDGKSQLYRANKALQEYVDLVQSNNIESAIQYWSAAALESSQRCNITYHDVSIKPDIGSPMIKSAKYDPLIELKSGRVLDSTYSMLDITAQVRGEIVRHHYYVGEIDGHPWLVFPHEYYCRDWNLYESRYFRVYVNPIQEPFVSRVALEALDTYVDSTGVWLGLSIGQLADLSKAKIDYFFCADEEEVKRVTGNLTSAQGRYDLASDALFSESISHYHEVTHFLVNYRQKSLALHTLPILKEGIATLYGGRAGLAAPGLLDMAAFLYMHDQMEVENLLELMSFHNDHDASFSYPGAALFLKRLIDEYGIDAFFELYDKLSGDFLELKKLSAQKVRETIELHFETDWSAIMRTFEDKYVSGRFRETPGYPRLTPGTHVGSAETASDAVLELGNVSVQQVNGRVYVTGTSDVGGKTEGSILFGKLEEPPRRSDLFEKHFGTAESYSGYRFGIRFDQFEAGLYDYATSTLLAKHLSGFESSDTYWNASDSTITFSFLLALSNGISPIQDGRLYNR